jgi:hypothetical protein
MAGKYKQKSRQRVSIERADQDKPRKVPLTGDERSKAFRDCRGAEREGACQTNTSNAATAADSLMKLKCGLLTDMDVGEPTAAVEVRLRTNSYKNYRAILQPRMWLITMRAKLILVYQRYENDASGRPTANSVNLYGR